MVIAGAGLTGACAAPYERPPLSKAVMTCKAEPVPPTICDAAKLAEARVEFIGRVAATVVDRAAHEVHLADGHRIPYSRLLIATGAQARKLGIPDAGRLRYLRSFAEAIELRGQLSPGYPGRDHQRRFHRPRACSECLAARLRCDGHRGRPAAPGARSPRGDRRNRRRAASCRRGTPALQRRGGAGGSPCRRLAHPARRRGHGGLRCGDRGRRRGARTRSSAKSISGRLGLHRGTPPPVPAGLALPASPPYRGSYAVYLALLKL
jgi:Pyridine nucleotide-disulphide oxidoreductase